MMDLEGPDEPFDNTVEIVAVAPAPAPVVAAPAKKVAKKAPAKKATAPAKKAVAKKEAPVATAKKAPAKKAVAKKAVAKKTTPKAEGSGTRGRTCQHAGKKLYKLVEGNPRKKDTNGYNSFKVIKDGMTYEQFIAKGGRLVDLNWDIEKGNVKVK